MSSEIRTCTVCGEEVNTSYRYVYYSNTTGRVWCGCRELIRGLHERDMVAWVYDANTVHEFGPEEGPVRLPERPSWDDYYLGIAKAVSARGDCARRIHGAVIVKNHKIVSTGYNGTPPGSDKSCRATGVCPRNLENGPDHSAGSYDLCWATHAEANAIIRASWEELQGSTIYVTGLPCPGCLKLIHSSGIVRVVHQ